MPAICRPAVPGPKTSPFATAALLRGPGSHAGSGRHSQRIPRATAAKPGHRVSPARPCRCRRSEAPRPTGPGPYQPRRRSQSENPDRAATKRAGSRMLSARGLRRRCSSIVPVGQVDGVRWPPHRGHSLARQPPPGAMGIPLMHCLLIRSSKAKNPAKAGLHRRSLCHMEEVCEGCRPSLLPTGAGIIRQRIRTATGFCVCPERSLVPPGRGSAGDG